MIHDNTRKWFPTNAFLTNMISIKLFPDKIFSGNPKNILWLHDRIFSMKIFLDKIFAVNPIKYFWTLWNPAPQQPSKPHKHNPLNIIITTQQTRIPQTDRATKHRPTSRQSNKATPCCPTKHTTAKIKHRPTNIQATQQQHSKNKAQTNKYTSHTTTT